MSLDLLLSRWMPSFLLVLCRCGAVVALTPGLGSRSLPLPVRIGLAGVLAAILTPVLVGQRPSLPSDPFALAAVLGGECVVGAVLGLAVRLLFAGMSVAGDLAAVQMGIGLPATLDPHTQLQVSSVNQLLDQIALLTFLLAGGHHAVLAGMAHSLSVIPPRFVSLGGGVMELLVQLCSAAFTLALRLAAPVGAAMLATMITLGLLNRMAPQVNVFAVSFTMTVGVGVLVLLAALPVLTTVWVGQLGNLPVLLLRLLAGMRHGL
jgi:flagellar biosynthetic protein FliR